MDPDCSVSNKANDSLRPSNSLWLNPCVMSDGSGEADGIFLLPGIAGSGDDSKNGSFCDSVINCLEEGLKNLAFFDMN